MSWRAKLTGSPARARFRMGIGAAVMAMALSIAGCGFQPLYGTSAGPAGMQGGGESLRTVEIALISNRPGQKLRNALIDRMHRDGAVESLYRLSVGYSAYEQKLAVSKDASTERVQLVYRAAYTLTRKSDGATLLKSVTRSNIVYDFLDEQYGLLVAREDAYDRAIIESAEEITMRVAAALGRADASAKAP